MPGSLRCPESQELQQFVLGQLAEAQVALLEEHLAQCPRCVEALSTLATEDPLLETLRNAETVTPEPEGEVIENLIVQLKELPLHPPAADTDVHSAALLPSLAASQEPHPYSFLAPPQQPDELGRLGPYRVLGVLGTGGMGVVFQAEDTQLQRLVALKVVKPELAANPAARQRFLREARAAAALTHDHIVTIYQVGEDRGVLYLAMQLLQGESLDNRLRRQFGPRGNAPLAVAEAIRIGREIAAGLAAAHELGLIHRDIKPANIWLEADGGRVKILDFGLARVSTDVERITDPGMVAGTPQYMAPEQAEGGSVDFRCDLFSLGCVLYRVCTADLPFRGVGAIGILRALALEQPRSPRDLNPEIPPELADLILKLLAKKPAERPPSARAVAQTLATLASRLATMGISAGDPSTVLQEDTQTRRQADKQIRRRRWTRLAWSAVALVLLGAGLLAPGIILRIKHKDGRVTEINLQPGDKLEIDGEGKVVAQVPAPDLSKIVPRPKVILNPLGPLSTVLQPAPLAGVHSWTLASALPWSDVHDLCFSPDSRWLAVAGGDSVVRIWDTTAPARPHVLVGHLGEVWCVAWSPDGKLLASGGRDQIVRVWDAASGQSVQLLRGHTSGISSLAWSPEGKTLASSSHVDDFTARLWDPATGRQRLVLREEKGPIKSVAWAPDGKRLVSANVENTLRFWDAESGRQISVPHNLKGRGHGPVWSPDGKKVAYRTEQSVGLLDPDSGQTLKRIDGQKIGSSLQWFPDSQRLLCGGLPGTVKVLDTATGKVVQTLDNKAYGVWHVALSPDGKQVATTTTGACIRLFDLASGQLRHAVTPPRPANPRAVAFAPDGQTLACGSTDHTVRLWDARSGNLLRTLRQGKEVRSLAWTADGKRLAAGDESGRVHFWESEAGRSLGEHSLSGPVLSLAWLANGRDLVAAGGEVRLRDYEAGQGRRVFEGSAEFARCLALSPDGTKLAGGGTGAVQIWDIRSGEPLQMLKAHTGRPVTALAWSPEGKRLAVGIDSDGLAVRVWEVEENRYLRPLETDHVHTLAWSPNGRRLAVGSGDGVVRVWDPESSQLVWDRVGDVGTIWSVGWAPDGRMLASTGGGAVRLWEGDTGRPLGVLRLLREDQWLAISPQGHYRGVKAMEEQLLYAVQTAQGQRTLTAEEFAQAYGWKNDRERVGWLGP